MKKQARLISSAFVLLSAAFPLNLWSQTRVLYTKASILRMDVMSRAALFEPLIAEAARQEGVDPGILWAIAYNESRFRPWLTSPKNAQGMMQFMPATASRFGLSNPYGSKASIFAAAKYVRLLSGLFDSRLDSILAAYNSGEGTVMAYLKGQTLTSNGKRINPSKLRTIGGVPPYRETTNYVASGLTIYRWLESRNKFNGLLAGSRFKVFQPSEIERIPQSPRKKSPTKNDDNQVARIVLYDPRTGKRRMLNSRNETSILLEQSGPVVISPSTRPASSQIARTTFFGIALTKQEVVHF